MKVESIERSQVHYDSFIITLESGERIRSFASVVEAFGLEAGMELTDSEIESLRIASDCSDIEERARVLVARRPMTQRELARHLMDEGIKREWAEGTAMRFETLGLVSDLEFACMLAEHLSSRNYGIEHIKAEFFERKIDESVWDEALKRCPPQEELLRREVPKLMARSGISDRTIARVTHEMLRRGFVIEDIEKIIQEYLDDAGKKE